MTELALFPLQSVLLPGMPLGLQIFEPRYLQLLNDVELTGNRFGVVMITRGSEVGGDDQRSDVGVIAHIRQKRRVPGDRWLVEAVGVDRFRILNNRDDDPYPKAEVEVVPQQDGAGFEAAFGVLREQFDRFLALAGELGADVSGLTLASDPATSVYQVAAMVPISDYDRYQILAADTLADGAEALTGAVEGATEILKLRLTGQ